MLKSYRKSFYYDCPFWNDLLHPKEDITLPYTLCLFFNGCLFTIPFIDYSFPKPKQEQQTKARLEDI
jgi:hypothetical protein